MIVITNQQSPCKCKHICFPLLGRHQFVVILSLHFQTVYGAMCGEGQSLRLFDQLVVRLHQWQIVCIFSCASRPICAESCTYLYVKIDCLCMCLRERARLHVFLHAAAFSAKTSVCSADFEDHVFDGVVGWIERLAVEHGIGRGWFCACSKSPLFDRRVHGVGISLRRFAGGRGRFVVALDHDVLPKLGLLSKPL